MFAIAALLIGVVGIFYVRRRSSRKKQRPFSASPGTDRRPTRARSVAGGLDSRAEGSEEFLHHARGARGAVPRERRVHPSLRKEDVARLLDVPQQREARAGCTARKRPREADGGDTHASSTHGSRRRFPTSANAREERVAHRRIGRQRRPHECEARLSIGVLVRSSCASRISCRSRHLADSELLRQHDLVRLGERAGRGPVSSFPHPARAIRAPPASCATSRSAENHADFRLWCGARSSPAAERPLERRRQRLARLAGRNVQNPAARTTSMRCTFCSSRSRGSARDEDVEQSRAPARPSSMSSHSVTHARRVSAASGISAQMCSR